MDTQKTPATTEELVAAAKRYAYSLCKDEDEAKDLTQQTWMKLLSKYGEVANRRILYTAIRNLWYDQLRRRKVVDFAPLESAPEPKLFENFAFSMDMETALESLSENERQSILLNVVEGYTAREISEKLRIPRGTILSHLCRARSKLKSLFSEEFGKATPALA